MKGYIYITGTGTDPGAKGNLNDPTLTRTPTLGACMPNIRRAVSLGDYIFVISGATKGVQQYVVGGFRVAEKISALEAYERFPEHRLSIDANGQLQGNVIIGANGRQHPLDKHDPATFERRIEDYIVGRDPVVLSRPEEVQEGRLQTLDRLSEILERPRANRVIDLMGRWAKLDEHQVNRTVDWLRGIRASA